MPIKVLPEILMTDEMPNTHLWIRDIKENDKVSGLYLVKSKRAGLTRKGEPFLSMTLADRSGDIEARVWEKAEELSSLFREGDIVEVEGYASSYRDQVQITLSNLKILADSPEPALFMETAGRDVSEMMGALREILQDIENSDLKGLIQSFLADRQFFSLFRKAPAAKSFHHGYIGGLLEHTLSVCQMAVAVCAHYPQLDRDLLLAGAFLHDIGKIGEMRADYAIDYTDEGRLLGHLLLGVAMLDEKVSGLKAFPRDMALRLKHLIISHHGEYEFGSPKRPKFLEAFALHLIDDLDAKMNGLSRLIGKDPQEGNWTQYSKLFDRYFFKGRRPAKEDQPDSDLAVNDRQKTLFTP
jgi:3'-5' exoribonuclease